MQVATLLGCVCQVMIHQLSEVPDDLIKLVVRLVGPALEPVCQRQSVADPEPSHLIDKMGVIDEFGDIDELVGSGLGFLETPGRGIGLESLHVKPPHRIVRVAKKSVVVLFLSDLDRFNESFPGLLPVRALLEGE